MNIRDKNSAISYIRALATIMVVIIHICMVFSAEYGIFSYIGDWMNIGLVLFFSISGYLYAVDTRRFDFPIKWFIRRYLNIVIPALGLLLGTAIWLYVILDNGIEISKYFVNGIISCLGFEVFVNDGYCFKHLWFLTYILVCYLTVPLLRKINFQKLSDKVFWFLIIVVSLLLQGGLSGIQIVLGIPTLSWGVLLRFYLVYMLFRRYDICSEGCKKLFVFLSVLSCIGLVIVCYVRYGMNITGVMASIGELLFIYEQTLLGTVVFYWLYLLFIKCKKRKWLEITDRYSYMIYLTHYIFLVGTDTAIVNCFQNTKIGCVAALVITLIFTVVLEFACRCGNMLIRKLEL